MKYFLPALQFIGQKQFKQQYCLIKEVDFIIQKVEKLSLPWKKNEWNYLYAWFLILIYWYLTELI